MLRRTGTIFLIATVLVGALLAACGGDGIVSIFPDSLANVVPGGERPLPKGNL